MQSGKSKAVLAMLVGLGSAAILAACGGGGDSSASSGQTGTNGSFSLAITDAPVDDAASVVVEFSGVSIKPAEGEAIEILFDEPKTIDLLALQGTLSQNIVTGFPLAAGRYEWIRLHVNAEQDDVLDSYIETETGTQLELRVPSGSQAGLKLVRGFTVLAGGTADFTVDFDLRKSIVAPPAASGKSILLKPVLRLIDNVSAGSISGTVDGNIIAEACTDPSADLGAVYAFTGAGITPADVSGAETDPLTTSLVRYEGDAYSYELGFLAAGNYTLAYTCDAAIDDPEAVDQLTFVGTATVAVEEGTETTFDVVLGETDAEESAATD